MTLDESTAAEAGRLVRHLVDAVSEDAGSPPRVCDLLDVLAMSVPGLGEGLDALPDELPVEVVLPRGRRHRCTESLAVHEVGDHVFVDAVHFLSWLVTEIRRRDGAPVDARVLAHAVLQAVRASGVRMVDLDPAKIVALEPKVVSPRARLSAGDVVVIPTGTGLQFFAVVLTPRCTFGTALGLLLDRGAAEALGPHIEVPGVLRRPVFTDDRSVSAGTWRVVGHDDSLLARFPGEPEIYHRPDPVLESLGLRLGPFGAAETTSRSLRLLDEAEAREIGVLDADFRQTYDSQQLQQMLGDLCASAWRVNGRGRPMPDIGHDAIENGRNRGDSPPGAP